MSSIASFSSNIDNLQKVNVLSLFDNVPETDLSISLNQTRNDKEAVKEFIAEETNPISTTNKCETDSTKHETLENGISSSEQSSAPVVKMVSREIIKNNPRKSSQLTKGGKKCEICGTNVYCLNFKKRFCSRTCIAKHACIARAKQIHANRSNGISSLKIKRNRKPIRNKSLSLATKNSKKLKFHSFPPHSTYTTARLLDDKKQRSLKRVPLKKRKLSRIMDEVLSDFQTFNWNNYLSDTNSRGLGPDEFQLITGRNPYPLSGNPFKVGNYLEAVDPVHPSLISLVSVAQVEGFRMRLHFEGYLEPFDFWVNADCPLIFPCGFCEDTGRTLSAPDDWDKSKRTKTEQAFSNRVFTNKTRFVIGEKLEAVNKRAYDLVCVATVLDIIGDYLLIHFDGCENNNAYWTNSSSSFIHPVGWCEENKKLLTPPRDQDPSSTFYWKKYLNKTNSKAADASCFVMKTQTFEKSTKMEVVDQRNPMLVRVATIVETTSIRIKVHFDGWNNILDDWIDLDSLDIHPVHWCSKAGFPLHPPVNCKMVFKKPCPTFGCSGLGHTNSYKKLKYHKKHYTEHGCPYTKKNMQKSYFFDRFLIKTDVDFVRSPKCVKRKEKRKVLNSTSHDFSKPRLSFEEKNSKRKSNHLHTSAAPKSSKSETQFSNEKDKFQDELFGVLFGKSQEVGLEMLKDHLTRSSFLSSFAGLNLPYCWDQIVKQLPGVTGIRSSQVLKWDAQKVGFFVAALTGKVEYQTVFEQDEVDGEAFLLLTQNDIIKNLNVKLGPAVKIYNAILLFKVLDEIEKKKSNSQ